MAEIKVTIETSVGNGDLCEEVINELTVCLDKVPVKYREFARFEVNCSDCGDEWNSWSVNIVYTREETPQEEAERISAQVKNIMWRIKKDKALREVLTSAMEGDKSNASD